VSAATESMARPVGTAAAAGAGQNPGRGEPCRSTRIAGG